MKGKDKNISVVLSGSVALAFLQAASGLLHWFLLIHIHSRQHLAAQEHGSHLISPPSLLLCTAQLTKHICVYCAISAEYTEQGNDMQQRPRNDAPALCIAYYLQRRRHASPSEAQLR